MKTLVVSGNANIPVELRISIAMDLLNTKQLLEINKNVLRNDPCICGSGIKFKKCHMDLFIKQLNLRK